MELDVQSRGPFSDTKLSYSLQLYEAAKSIWEPTVENPIILNLLVTLETSVT